MFDISNDLTDNLSQCTPPLNGVSSNTTTPHSKLSTVCRTPIVKVTKLLHSPSRGVSIPSQKTVPPVSVVDQGGWCREVEVGEGEGRGRESRLSETPPLEECEVVVEAEGMGHVEGGGMEGEGEGGFNNVPLNTSGPSEHSTEKGDVETADDAPVQSSLVTHCDTKSQQTRSV